MSCFECMLTVPILLLRFLVWSFPCFFKLEYTEKHPFDVQLQLVSSAKGGWYTGHKIEKIMTRDTFLVLFAKRMRHKCTDEVEKFAFRLAEGMNAKGQIPCGFSEGWYSTTRYYLSDVKKEPVLDSNIFFLIMVWWLHAARPQSVKKLYLHCQRAYQWLSLYVCNDTIHEPIDASWETTRHHSGHLLLTNIYMIQAIRSMELIHMTQKNVIEQAVCVAKHTKFMQKWQSELYRTQEVWPRMLAVHWNMTPDTFLISFNQELQYVHIPLRTAGPIVDHITYHSRVRGIADLHTTTIWPFIGFFWIIVTAKRLKMDIANSWWTSYLEFGHRRTLYDVYSSETGLPIRRAFFKATAGHAATISMYLSAKQIISRQQV